jgi:hypothetical protein
MRTDRRMPLTRLWAVLAAWRSSPRPVATTTTMTTSGPDPDDNGDGAAPECDAVSIGLDPLGRGHRRDLPVAGAAR